MSRFGSVMISRAKTEKIEELEKELSTELKQFETAKKQQGIFSEYSDLILSSMLSKYSTFWILLR